MIGFFKQWAANASEYKQLQQELTAVLARSGIKFMQLHPKITNFLVNIGREDGAAEAVAKLDEMMVMIADTFPHLNQEKANKQLIHAIEEINRLAKSH